MIINHKQEFWNNWKHKPQFRICGMCFFSQRLLPSLIRREIDKYFPSHFYQIVQWMAKPKPLSSYVKFFLDLIAFPVRRSDFMTASNLKKNIMSVVWFFRTPVTLLMLFIFAEEYLKILLRKILNFVKNFKDVKCDTKITFCCKF